MKRRSLLHASLLATAAFAAPAFAQDGPASHLLVGDTAADRLYVYSVPEFDLLADLAGIRVGAHSGIIALPDGRALIPDEAAKQLVVLRLSEEAAPAIVARVPMPIFLENIQVWSAVDPTLEHYFSISNDEDSTVGVLTIVDLETYQPRQIKIDGGGEGEMHVVAGGDPAMVFLHLADRVDVYPLAALLGAEVHQASILAGEIAPVATFPVGEGGHSNSFSIAAGKWTGSTLRGLEIATLDASGVSGAATVPWEADGLSGGRNARERLTPDGAFEFGPLNASLPPEQWADVKVDLHWVDLEDETVTRMPLAGGVVGRGGVSQSYAVYANVHPDGDFANLVDVDSDSPTFQEVVARIPLDRLADGPVAGTPTAGTQARHSGITPDGAFAFVTHGGEGKISVIDTASQSVVETIVTPTSLSGGGYVIGTTLGAPLFELAGR
jgi:hypothetical protein